MRAERMFSFKRQQVWGVMLILLCTAQGVLAQKPDREVLGNEPWKPPSSGAKVIYGDDDRIDYYQESDARVLQWADSTCALVDSYLLTQHIDGSYSMATRAYTQRGLPACDGEAFADQPTAPFCSGFVVGEDLIATAGHCYDQTDLSMTLFVFGFYMLDALTPVTDFDENQVYQGVEVVGRALGGNEDFSVVRVDRPITAPGTAPFEIRREGEIAVGSHVGVIGYPSKLPLKIALGNNTVVRENSNDGYFVANLDTYGGNSGSPVIDPNTGLVEGILVRGETDFIFTSTCFYSNKVPNEGGRGEDVSKSTSFMHLLPNLISSSGRLVIKQEAVSCQGFVSIELCDSDLRGSGQAALDLVSDQGESESIILMETGVETAIFSGDFSLVEQAPTAENQVIEVEDGALLIIQYDDANDSSGQQQTQTATVRVDCSPPQVISDVTSYISGAQANIAFTTSETASARIEYGQDCAALNLQQQAIPDTLHSVTLNNLDPEAQYFFRIVVTDLAGNGQVEDNGGACFSPIIQERLDYMTEIFESNDFDLSNSSLTFMPADIPDAYVACKREISEFAVPAEAGISLSLNDDDSEEVILTDGKSLQLFGLPPYDRVFIGSNGYLTFSLEDTAYSGSLVNHFSTARVALLFADLDPSQGGSVRYQQLSDRFVVSYKGVPQHSSQGVYPEENSNSFQVELFFDGTIRMSWLDIYSTNALVGLSQGNGYSVDYVDSALSETLGCDVLDSDEDGLTNLDELNVYGTQVFNEDSDDDGLLDGWEVDFELDPLSDTGVNGATGDPDEDGLDNLTEAQLGTIPQNPDSDTDGLEDGWEVTYDLDPLDNRGVNGAEGDPDEDDLSNEDEQQAQTSPRNPDCDGDTLSDGWEVVFGLDPLSDVGEDGLEGDPDEDGLSNGIEQSGGTSPRNPDSDWDGISDPEDPNPTGAGLLHAADTDDTPWVISLSELLRVIQLYNSLTYHCGEAGVEDGYATGAGDGNCFYHNSDYNPQDWTINLSELLRMIQFYQLESYRRDVRGEDGFNPLQVAP